MNTAHDINCIPIRQINVRKLNQEYVVKWLRKGFTSMTLQNVDYTIILNLTELHKSYCKTVYKCAITKASIYIYKLK